MNEIRDPIPPGHGEPRGQGGARPGEDPSCWCGRPLKLATIAYPNGISTRRRDCSEHGYARYVVQLVQRDGVPRVVFRSTELAFALEEAERLRDQGWAGARGFVGVVDEDDGERGWLSEDDLVS